MDVALGSEKLIIDKAGKTILKYPSLRYLGYATENIFIIKHINDSFYTIDHNGSKIYERGANATATFDNQIFLFQIGSKVFSLYNNTLSPIPLDNVGYIAAYKMGLYYFETTATDNKTGVTVFNNTGNSLATKQIFYKFRKHDDLQLLEAYWEVKDVGRSEVENYYDHYVYSYLNTSG